MYPLLDHSALYAAFDVYPSSKGAATHIARMARTLFDLMGGGLLYVLGAPDLPAYQREGEVEILRYSRAVPNLLERGIAFGRRLSRVLDERGAALDVCHFRDPWSGGPLLARERRAYATIYEVNGLPSIELPYAYPMVAPRTLEKIREIERRCWSEADRVITPSRTIRDNLVALGAPRERITVIPNGADLAVPGARPAGAPGSYLIYVGALQAWQGVDVWLRAFAALGFSRGAAIARRFVSHLQTRGTGGMGKGDAAGPPVPVRFLGVWDAVLSEGAPQKNDGLRDPRELGEENGLAAGVGRVLHLVSIDDPRLIFTPTLFAPDERVTEVWCAGVHSDVGGGYRVAGLSDMTLEFMIERAREEAGLAFAADGVLDPSPVTGGLVEKDDLDHCPGYPDYAADDHVETFEKLIKDFFDALGPRKVMTIGGGVPLLHPSVVERGRLLGTDYRPENLASLQHAIWGRPGEHAGFASHFGSS